MIAVADYGAGNVRSVLKALSYIGCDAQLTADREKIMSADALVLPGVGAFGDAMAALRAGGMDAAVKDYIASDRPFLGICLGMQVLFGSSEEAPEVEGLDVMDGKVLRIPADTGLKVPHIGWNSLDVNNKCPLFNGIGEHPYVYFVHSYYLSAEDESIVAATAEYGVKIHASAWKGNCFATQFHPEKSGDVGLNILRNFAKISVEGGCGDVC